MTTQKPQEQNQTDNPRAIVASQAEGIAEQGVSALRALAPADKSWIAGFIVVVAIIVLSDMWVNIQQIKANSATSIRTQSFFEEIETNRAAQADQMAQVFSDQVRRSQEVIRDLAQAVSRDSERSGLAAMSAIEDRSEILKDGGEILEPTGGRP